jgi:glucose/arabinose dehydrogenase
MHKPLRLIALLLPLLLGGCINLAWFRSERPLLEQIRLPAGFRIEVLAEVPGARSLARGDRGTLFIGTRGEGKVYALELGEGPKAGKLHVIAEGLNMPNGVAFRQGALYVAEVDKIWRYDSIESRLSLPPAPLLLFDSLPSDAWHGWKYIRFGPDDRLYVPVGAPCNVCESEDRRHASMLRLRPDGSGAEIFAEGIRNSVGFDFHPQSGELWFTDNGRDLLGDDQPNDELNRAPVPGLHFGFPYCHNGELPDPRFGEEKPCAGFTPPVQKLAPHGAALGMLFYEGSAFPEPYRGSIFVAEHGSWNRREPIGYRITRVQLRGNEALAYEPFAEGWLQDGKAWGRPVDLLLMPDGSLLLSDDHAGLIYRIWYEG